MKQVMTETDLSEICARLSQQIDAIVQVGGGPRDFDAGAWLSTWLREPLPAIGGQRPIDLLGTEQGQAIVAKALAQIQSGAYG